MSNELICARLKSSVSKHCKVFLREKFKFEGTITGCDDTWLEILEPTGKYRVIKLEEITDAEIGGEENEV